MQLTAQPLPYYSVRKLIVKQLFGFSKSKYLDNKGNQKKVRISDNSPEHIPDKSP
jgi:hypothetical protein